MARINYLTAIDFGEGFGELKHFPVIQLSFKGGDHDGMLFEPLTLAGGVGFRHAGTVGGELGIGLPQVLGNKFQSL